jgi:hypothetical protein
MEKKLYKKNYKKHFSLYLWSNIENPKSVKMGRKMLV